MLTVPAVGLSVRASRTASLSSIIEVHEVRIGGGASIVISHERGIVSHGPRGGPRSRRCRFARSIAVRSNGERPATAIALEGAARNTHWPGMPPRYFHAGGARRSPRRVSGTFDAELLNFGPPRIAVSCPRARCPGRVRDMFCWRSLPRTTALLQFGPRRWRDDVVFLRRTRASEDR